MDPTPTRSRTLQQQDIAQRLYRARDTDLIGFAYHPERILRNGEDTEVNRLVLLEALAQKNDGRIKTAVASQLDNLPQISSRVESPSHGRLITLGLNLVFDPSKPDTQPCAEAVLVMGEITAFSKPQNRLMFLDRLQAALDNCDEPFKKDLVKEIGELAVKWSRKAIALSQAEQHSLFELYEKICGTNIYIAAAGTHRVGQIVLLCPKYLDEYLDSFIQLAEKTDPKSELIQEEIGNSLDYVAQAIAKAQEAEPSIRDKRLEQLSSIIDSLSHSPNEFVRKKIARSLPAIQVVLPDSALSPGQISIERLCEQAIAELRAEDSLHIDRALDIGKERASGFRNVLQSENIPAEPLTLGIAIAREPR